MLKFIELNEDKTPKTNYSVTYPTMDNLDNAGLMLNDNVVICDFDGDNGLKEKSIINYINSNFPTLMIKTTKGVHFYYSKPKDIVIKSKADVITVGGFQCDYKTGNQYGIVKRYGKERERNRDLTLTDLPELPYILYPLSIKTNLSNMGDGDGRNNGINSHLYCIKNKYPQLDIVKIGEYINSNIFGEPMDDRELNNTINSVLSSNPLYDMEQYNGDKKDMISFAKWIVKKVDIKLYQNQLYFKLNDRFISNDTLLLREITKYIELNRQRDGELKHQLFKYADLVDGKMYKFKIQLRNAMLENDKVLAPTGEFTPFYLDVEYNQQAYDETVDNFLNFLCCNREDMRLVLEEILGHIILVNQFPHKIFFLVGDGANGKSTFIEMISKFTGDLSSHVDISNFDDGTSLTSLVGKLVNISDDVDAIYLEKSKNLKTMASGNTVGTRAIYSLPITIKNTATLIFTANEPPTFKDKSDGIIRRLMIIPFDNKVKERNPYIDDLLSSDTAKSYILNLALGGVKRIYDNKLELSLCSRISEVTRQYHLENDSVKAFVEAYPNNIENKTVEVAYGYYVQYTTSGNLRAVSRNMFSRRLTTLGYKTKVCKLGGFSIRKIVRADYE